MEAPVRIGRYELLEHVGHGSIGVLYRGRDTVLGREVAIKIMAAGLLGDSAAHERFFREARAAARLQHVNIVTVFEFGEHEDTPFIVMEFLRGSSLAERLRQPPPMSLRDQLDVGIQLCAGLESAHAQGVVHRDVKPGNVWLCLDGTVKLLDFAIATAASSAVTVANVLTSVRYMAPEQITGAEIDGRADIFAAGVVLCELFTGHRPFDADSPAGVMLKIVNEPAAITGAEIPPPLRSALLRSLEKSPADRYAKAAEFGRALKAVKATLPLPPETGAILIDRKLINKAAAPRPAGQPKDRVPPARSAMRGAPAVKSWLLPVGVIVALAVLAATVYFFLR
jgi:serine/threonine protein kinase